MKPYEQLTIQDDFVFGKVMQEKELCKELLEMILNVKIKDITYPELQKNFKYIPDGKGIRLDVYVEDNANTVYDVEMQTTNSGCIPKRTRFYQSMIDLQVLESGQSYEKLKKSFIIFICTFDLFKKGNHIYTFEMQCNELPGLKLGSGTKVIIINPYGTKDDVSPEMDAFLKYVAGNPATSDYTKKVDAHVKSAIDGSKWRHEYMLMEAKIMKAREEGRAEGRAEGLESLVNILKPMLPDFESVYCKIREQKKYADVTKEQVLRYYNAEH